MSEDWKQYLCRACGYVYDEAKGDPDSGLAPGTRFEDIPDDWMCPLCGVTKADFEPWTAPVAAVSPGAGRAAPRGVGVVIVGGGLAGWSVAGAIRALDAAVPVTLVSACAADVYHKPELSVALSRGMTAETLRRETGAEAAARLNIRLEPETFAIGIEPGRHTLRTTRGPLRYTQLVLAQGARPVELPGLPPELCWRVNDLRGWNRLQQALAGKPQRIAIVGAGMVGCELAEDLVRAGHAVTLVSLTDLPLQPLLPDPAAALLQANLQGIGIRFLGGTTVQAVARDGAALRVTTDKGETIEVDHVVSAAGLATETRLSRSAGLAFDRGIVVEAATLRTSEPDIYALGDCISIAGVPCRFIEPIGRQAEAIAHGVLGRAHEGYRHAAPVIRLKTRSTPLVIHGAPVPGVAWTMAGDGEGTLRMEQWLEGKLQARLVA